ncbi:hypothetical protein DPMN_073571 [Dreissena polymorpha]|uniref:Uncharacterized protein n=1 Tax=Dreissena polymorpha TaxID=45954 RepID=A0A9D4BZB3_DREPO|nr:hypothetical protein DPMN_073571 [Dreissena polymorpha]
MVSESASVSSQSDWTISLLTTTRCEALLMPALRRSSTLQKQERPFINEGVNSVQKQGIQFKNKGDN